MLLIKGLGIFLLVLIALVPGDVFAEDEVAIVPDRVALLIANWDYVSGQLPRAKEKVDKLAAALRSAGFKVTVKENVSHIQNDIEEFVSSSPVGGTSILYFTGHGHRFDRNLTELITNKNGEVLKEHSTIPDSGILGVEGEAYSLHSLANQFSTKCTSKLQMLFFDCADFCPEAKPDQQGLIFNHSSWPGSLVCFAMPPEQSLPKDTKSLMAESLLRHLTAKDQNIGSVMAKVKADVSRRSAGKQDIWFKFATKKDASVIAISSRKRRISTAPQPPSNPNPGDEWMNELGMFFCWCPAGKFSMGITKKMDVSLSEGFWISKYELTKGMRKRNGTQSYSNTQTKYGNMPWGSGLSNSRIFVSSLVENEEKKGRLPEGWTYRLPTEAEWEYACRAGSQTKYSFGDSADNLYLYANYADAQLHQDDDIFHYSDLKHNDGVGKGLAPVGSYRPNTWGIHDMHGNLSECVSKKGEGKKRGPQVHCGGAWCSTSEYCLPGFRNTAQSTKSLSFTGMRLVLAKVESE